MTTETMTKLEELLAKARETREAKRQQYEAVEAAAQAEKRQRIDEAVAEARAIVEPALGNCAFVVHDYDHNIRQFTVTPRAWRGLVEAVMEAEPGGMWKLISPNGKCYLSEPAEWESPAALAWLAAMDDLYQKRHADVVKWASESLPVSLNETYARETYARLLSLDETRAAEWDALLNEALEGIAARAAAFDAYVAILGAWRVEYERILTDNREMVQVINDRYDYRFDRHEVAYAAVGDEDDEPYRETAWAANGPDEDGWWRLYEDGRVVRRRLLRPLWVGDVVREKLSKAGAGGWRRAIFAHDAGESIYCLPWDEGEARQAMKSLVYPLPAEPSLPEELRDGLLTAERERINEVTRGMARVEIPF